MRKVLGLTQCFKPSCGMSARPSPRHRAAPYDQRTRPGRLPGAYFCPRERRATPRNIPKCQVHRNKGRVAGNVQPQRPPALSPPHPGHPPAQGALCSPDGKDDTRRDNQGGGAAPQAAWKRARAGILEARPGLSAQDRQARARPGWRKGGVGHSSRDCPAEKAAEGE